MKKAVGHLIPFMEKEREENKMHAGTEEEEASHFVQGGGPREELVSKTVTGVGQGPWGLAVPVIDGKIEQWSFTEYTLGFSSKCGFMNF